jgi:glutaryl-CoA dehydrogenase
VHAANRSGRDLISQDLGCDTPRVLKSDLYGAFEDLDSGEQQVLTQLRVFLEETAHPLLADHWERGEFPMQLVQPLIDLRLMDPPGLNQEPSALYASWRSFELARVDVSLATYYNGQAGLFRTAVNQGGSPAQIRDWDPHIRSWELSGVFALTEPDHGSDIAGGFATTCRKDGDHWMLNGAKRWIGGAGMADRLATFARDLDTGGVRCLLVDRAAPGVALKKITGKTALRIVQNFDIEFVDVQVEDEWRLAEISTFADVARCLRYMRGDVAWMATGAAAGAYEAALKYTLARHQFGQPLAGFQITQEKLVRMLANVTASLALCTRLTARAAKGVVRDEDSALAKQFTAARLRESVALAREVCGGNGITLEADVGRFHADAEAIYSYEGTNEINSLVVGRAATGISAFTRKPIG